ncbi:MAG: hypothetical protein EOP61_32140 [Sphingomonadales bacterium]|nr:MAG: hypothetical protein EOP61_32140 [Sphingomonadales bacterium]
MPELVLLALGKVLGFKCSGVGEKVRWSIYATVAGEPVVFTLRKFGFAILTRKESSLDLRRVIGQLKSALRVLEEHLEPFAQAQIDEGRVTIANRFSEFDARYRFHRERADRAYRRAKRRPRRKAGAAVGFGGLADLLNHRHRAESEGFFQSTAMIDAYFSRLEHRLILLRAFVGKPLAAGELRALIREDWGDKLKRFVDVAKARDARETYARLVRVKERIRNPFAHGGMENDRGALFFHVPGVGAMPANLTRFRDSVRFKFIPVEADDHAGACEVFDAMDALLSSGDLTGPDRLLEAGIDPQFDPDSLEDYRTAIGDAAALQQFLERWAHDYDRHVNMDY